MIKPAGYFSWTYFNGKFSPIKSLNNPVDNVHHEVKHWTKAMYPYPPKPLSSTEMLMTLSMLEERYPKPAVPK